MYYTMMAFFSVNLLKEETIHILQYLRKQILQISYLQGQPIYYLSIIESLKAVI